MKHDQDAVAGPVAATMVVALITLLIMAVYATTIPVWVKNAESDNMTRVMGQMVSMKMEIDTMIEKSQTNMTSTTAYSLKPDKVKDFFGFTRETFPGRLRIDPFNEYIQIYNKDDPLQVFGRCQGVVVFESRNQEYTNMYYIYADGGIMEVYKENAKGVMQTFPVFKLKMDSGKRVLYASSITITGDLTELSIPVASVQYSLLSGMVVEYSGGDWDNGINITMVTNSTLGYASIWESYYSKEMSNVTWMSAGTDYNITRSGDLVTLEVYNINRLVLYQGVVRMQFI